MSFEDPDEMTLLDAYRNGQLSWRERRANPYLVAGRPISPAWWYYWDFGRRESAFVYGVSLAKAEAGESKPEFKPAADPRQTAKFRGFLGQGA